MDAMTLLEFLNKVSNEHIERRNAINNYIDVNKNLNKQQLSFLYYLNYVNDSVIFTINDIKDIINNKKLDVVLEETEEQL